MQNSLNFSHQLNHRQNIEGEWKTRIDQIFNFMLNSTMSGSQEVVRREWENKLWKPLNQPSDRLKIGPIIPGQGQQTWATLRAHAMRPDYKQQNWYGPLTLSEKKVIEDCR